MLKAFIKLILSFIQADRDKRLYRSLYISEDTPKTYGTKIRRRNI